MTIDPKWDYRVMTYSGDDPMLETLHQGVHSKDMEVAASLACGRTAFVYDLRFPLSYPVRFDPTPETAAKEAERVSVLRQKQIEQRSQQIIRRDVDGNEDP